jgi:RNA polymerase sigma factor (sigma-70 family)
MEQQSNDSGGNSLRNAEDYALVQRALNHNDQQAYNILVERYRDSLHSTILKMVHHREDADDLTIEAFGKAFRRLDTYTPNFAFSTWLFKIGINNTIDFIRRRRISLFSIDETFDTDSKTAFSENIRSNNPDPEEHYIQEQRIKAMRNVLMKLAPKYRLMIEMRYFEDRTYQEIAYDLDIPIGTVKAQLFRAKELLNELFRENNTEDTE